MRWPKSFLELQSCLEIHIKIQVAETKPGVLFPVVRKSQVFSHRRAVQSPGWRSSCVALSERNFLFGGRVFSRRMNQLATAAWSKLSTLRTRRRSKAQKWRRKWSRDGRNWCNLFFFLLIMKNHSRETFSQKEQRTFVLFFFFQINLPAELKIQSTSALRYLTITQKRCFCAERGLSFHWNKLFFFLIACTLLGANEHQNPEDWNNSTPIWGAQGSTCYFDFLDAVTSKGTRRTWKVSRIPQTLIKFSQALHLDGYHD